MTDYAVVSLSELIVPGPAPCGLTVASGTSALLPVVEEMLVRFLDADGPVFWIDSGNYFNAYQMAEMAKRHGADPKKILRALRIARPFTAFQYQQMLEKIPSPGGIDRKERGSSSEARFPLIVISDLMGLFYDPEIQEDDMKRAFREFLVKLMKLKRSSVIIALLLNHEVPQERRALLPRVLALADRVHNIAPSLISNSALQHV
jgi:hypothetical protein